MVQRLRTLREEIPGSAGLGAAMLVITMASFFRVPLLPMIGADLGLSAGSLGLLTTLYALGRLGADLPVGSMADRIAPKTMMAFSAGVVAGGSLLLAVATASPVAMAAAFVLGIGSTGTVTTGFAYFSATAPIGRRGTFLSLVTAAMLVGQALGPTAAGLIASVGGWRLAEVAAAAMTVAVVIGMRTGDRLVAPSVRTEVDRAPRPGQIPLRLRVVLNAVPFAMFASLGAIPQTLIPIIGDRDLGLSPAVIGLALGTGGLCRLGGAIIGGQISDRLGRKRALIPALLVSSAGVAVLAAGPNLLTWLVAIGVMGIASFAISAAATMLADLSAGSGIGALLGRFRFAGDLGFIAAPAVAGHVFDAYGAPAAVLPIAFLLAAVGIAAAVILPETRWTMAL